MNNMNSNKIHDNMLEHYIDRINTSNNSNNKRLNLKKAIDRLQQLKIFYEKISNSSTNNENESLIDKYLNLPLEKIMIKIDKLENEIDNFSDDNIESLIKKTIKYQQYILLYEKSFHELKNEIYVVRQKLDEITLEKIDDF